MMSATTLAMMRDVMPSSRVGSGMGLLGTAIAIGSALGPAIGGVAIAVSGWRAAFFTLAPLGLLALVLVRRCVPMAKPPSRDRDQRFDWLGTILLGIGVSAYCLAVTLGQGGFGALNAVLVVTAVVAAVLFVLSQSRVRAPLVRPAAWRDAALRAGLLTNVCVAAVMMAFFVIAPFYLSGALGLADIALGAALAISPTISMATGFVAGRVVDRLGSTRMVTAGIAAMLIGCFGLAFLPSVWGLAGFILPLFCFTPGYQLFLAANSTAVMTAARSSERGVTSGMLSLSRGFGFITGTAALGSVFAAGASHVVTGDAAAAASGMRLMLLVGAGMLVVALVVSVRPRHRGKDGGETLDAPQTRQVSR
jgi:MFS family permease